jgi:glycosyltransferase involved in cell wall biosynthesis
MLWSVAAPFFKAANLSQTRWIADFVASEQHQFRKIAIPSAAAGPSWHDRAGRATPLKIWHGYWKTARAALEGAEGVITVFPPLAVTAALQRKLRRRSGVPIVAWCFNLGKLVGGLKQKAARFALRDVEIFVVHSSGEVPLIADYLGIPQERVRFVPLQRAPIAVVAEEEREAPFVVSMGSANRDYATLVEAARITGLPVTIVASPRSMEGLSLPENVSVLSGLSGADCRVLAQRARFSVVPLANVATASGQVTVIEAQRMARAVIATRSIGTVDYIDDGVTGIMVPPGDAQALAAKMQALWDDQATRTRIAKEGADFADRYLSDEAAGSALGEILDELAARRVRPI